MNGTAKIITIFSFLLLLFRSISFAQGGNPPEGDDEMGIFLMVIGTIFVCGILGATLIGAFAAALFLLTIGGLFFLGILSTAFLIGWYQRSFSAGYKSLLLIGCALLFGVAGLSLFSLLPWLNLDTQGRLLAGFTGGALGGLLIGYALYRFSGVVISFLIRKNSSRIKG